MKLSTIDPAKLARDTVRDAIDRIHGMLFALAPQATYRLELDDREPESTTVGHAVASLVLYAQGRARLDADVHEYCITLIPVAGDALDDSGTPDPMTPLGLVVAAALARERIEGGSPVSTTQLAILGDVTPGRVRQLVASGELVAPDGQVMPTEARRWLGARGVVLTAALLTTA